LQLEKRPNMTPLVHLQTIAGASWSAGATIVSTPPYTFPATKTSAPSAKVRAIRFFIIDFFIFIEFLLIIRKQIIGCWLVGFCFGAIHLVAPPAARRTLPARGKRAQVGLAELPYNMGFIFRNLAGFCKPVRLAS